MGITEAIIIAAALVTVSTPFVIWWRNTRKHRFQYKILSVTHGGTKNRVELKIAYRNDNVKLHSVEGACLYFEHPQLGILEFEKARELMDITGNNITREVVIPGNNFRKLKAVFHLDDARTVRDDISENVVQSFEQSSLRRLRLQIEYNRKMYEAEWEDILNSDPTSPENTDIFEDCDVEFGTIIPTNFGIDFSVNFTNHHSETALLSGIEVSFKHPEIEKEVHLGIASPVVCYGRANVYPHPDVPSGHTRAARASFHAKDLDFLEGFPPPELQARVIIQFFHQTTGGRFRVHVKHRGDIKKTVWKEFDHTPMKQHNPEWVKYCRVAKKI